MTISAAHRKAVSAKLEEVMAMVNAHYNTNLVAPPVVYDIRGGSCCGRITSRDNYRAIHLNAGMFIDNSEDMINDTAPHELAHWAEWKIFGEWEKVGRKRSVHGARWSKIMHVMGLEAKRLSDGYDLSNVKVKRKKKYEYLCEGRCGNSLTLTSVAHNRIVRGTHKYSCRCGGSIKAIKALGQVSFAEAKAARSSQDSPTPPKAPRAPKAPSIPGTSKVTKKSRAIEMYKRNPSQGRDGMIKMFMERLDMTKAGATTYWNIVINS